MPLIDFIGPWMYWPLVVATIAGSISWTLNCISVTYTEVCHQIQELIRVSK